MSLTASIIDDFAQEIIVNRDDQPQTILNGKIVPATTRQFAMIAAVQPLKGNEILMFEEADRLRQSIKIYSYTELKVLDEKRKTKADLIVYADTTFEIVSVERWVDSMASESDDDFIYFKSIGRRVDRA